MLKRNPYVILQYNKKGQLLMVNTYASNILRVKKEQGVDFANTYETLEGNSAIIKILLEKGIIYDDEKQHLMNYDELYEDFINFSGRELRLILLPTEGCNFRCTYCYENHDSKVMSQNVQDGVVEYVRKNIDKYKAVRMEWFGGEPLCQIGIINSLTKRVREICKSAKRPFFSGMTTNGYLLDLETFQQMFRKNKVINYQITIDGLPEAHNIQRALANKEETFQKILDNLRAIRDNVKSPLLQIVIRCNVTRLVKDGFQEYLEILSKEFGDDLRFSLFWKIAWDPTKATSGEYCSNDEFDDLLTMAEDKKIRLDLHMADLKCYGSICYASFPSGFVIGTDGKVYKCTVAFDDDINAVGCLRQDGTMVLDEQKHQFWIGKIEAPNLSTCKECRHAPACLGISCRYYSKDEDGNIRCPDYIFHLKHLINLVGDNDNNVEEVEVTYE